MARRGPYEKPSKSSSSIGLKATIAEAEVGSGTVSVSAGLSIDISPVDIGVSVDEGNLSVSTEIGLPGDVVSVGGGAVVDLNTGAIVGGSASLGIGGAEVEVSQVECERGISISYFGISLGYSQDICGKDDDNNGNNNEDDDNGNNNNKPLDPSDFPETPALLIFTRKPIYKTTQAPASIVRVLNPNIELTPTVVSYSNLAQQGTLGIIPYSILQDIVNSDYIGDYSYPTGRTNWCCLSDNINANPASVLPRWRFKVGYLGNLYEGWIVTGGEFFWETDQVSFSCYSLQFQAVELVYTGNPRKFIQAHNYLSFEGIDKFTVGGNFGSNLFGRHFRSSQKVDRIIPVTLGEDQRRPIPSGGEDMGECCDASISLLRKIAKVLAVEEMLAPLKTSGKILKEAEKGIDKVLEDPDLEVEMDNYLVLNTFLSLLSNRKVAVAVGCDELEFEKDKKEPKFNYLRWLKEYGEGKTNLTYEDWIKSKSKDDGLNASTTQFKSIPQLMLAELLNSKTTVDVLRARDIIKTGMEIPNELFVPGGLGFTVANDYPNIFKKIIQILDLSTIQPFTAVLQDSDPSKEGDQILTKYYPDATSVAKEIVELLLENKVDSATRLNIALRQSILNTQQQVALLETLSIAYTIMYGLGLPFDQKGSHFVAPFDISPKTDGTKDETKGKAKGFNPKNKKEDEKVQSAIDSLNDNSEKSTEKMLPDFLSTVRQEYLHTYFDDKNESLWYYIMSVFMKT